MKIIDITGLQNTLNVIEGCISDSERINTNVSKVNVAWHLDHSLKVINSVIKNMQNSDSALYVDNFSFLGKLLLKLKFYPRGKAKAPKYVLPSETILIDDNPQRIAEVKQTMREAFTMIDKGMGMDEIMDILAKTKRTKQATGGRVRAASGGLARILNL